MSDSLDDRMKSQYEDAYRIYLTRRTPVIIRLDGRAFHTVTKSCQRPFDSHFMDSMVLAAQMTAHQMQGFKMGYVASDEVSFFLTDYDRIETSAWFDYNLSKVLSISASLMTAHFNQLFFYTKVLSPPVFDGRVFNIPKEEVANYFLWRCRDWERNSLLMYCQSFFSHNELMNKGREDQHEMLHKIGKNWAFDLTTREKNGTLIFRDRIEDDFNSNYVVLDTKIENEMKKEVKDETSTNNSTDSGFDCSDL